MCVGARFGVKLYTIDAAALSVSKVAEMLLQRDGPLERFLLTMQLLFEKVQLQSIVLPTLIAAPNQCNSLLSEIEL